MEEPKAQNVNISPLAMLAAVLFHADTFEKIKVKADDSGEVQDIEVPTVQIQKEDEGVACVIPLKRILHFALHTYNMNFRVIRPEGELTEDNSAAVITFEKATVAARILNANGKAIATESKILNKTMERFK